jgi:hypothetical protein
MHNCPDKREEYTEYEHCLQIRDIINHIATADSID